MDKYTYSLKADKIQKLVREGDYATAVKIADTMEWGQERSVRLLTAASEAYEKTGQYQLAIDLMLAAYDRAAVGKRMLYKLTELEIKNGSMKDAETFYKKYLEEASDENNRYILRYLIAEAKGEALDRKISILETYRKHEFEEKWACRLAELYQEGGREKECVALCDEIILWFGVGKYVDRAMELKEMYQPLTDSQRERREHRAYYEEKVREVAKEMEAALERPVEEETPEEWREIPIESRLHQTEPETKSVTENPLEEPAADEGEELPKIVISKEVAAAFGGETEESTERPAEQNAEKPEPEAVQTDSQMPLSEKKPAKASEEPTEMPEEPAKASEELVEMPEEPAKASEELVEIPEEPAKASEELVEMPEEPAEVSEESVEMPVEPADAKDKMFEEEEEETSEDVDQTKRLNLYASIRSPKTPMPEELAKTQEVILPSQLRERPQVEHVVQETSVNMEEEQEQPVSGEDSVLPAAETEPEGPTVEAPETLTIEESAEDTPQETLQPASGEKEENPASAESEADSGLEKAAEISAEDEPLPLEKDANVLPVLSYEETEKAVWEDQNRRMEQREPLEIHEMEHCIFISAANSAEGVNKAVEALEEHYRKENRELSAIAKITGEKLNRRGLVRSLPQLKKKDLIIDEAGKLDDAIIVEMLEILEYLEPGKVFVLLETPEETDKLRQRVRSQIIEAAKTHGASADKQAESESLPKIQLTQTEEALESEREKESADVSAPESQEKEAEKRPDEQKGVRRVSFANLSEDQVLSERDFLRYAEYFARELECSIDSSGMDAIEDECRLIREEGGCLTVGEAEAMIEDAAEHAEKHTLKRLFTAKYDKEGYLILRKRNFA